MKNKIVYGSDKDDFIWKIETIYNPIEELHLRLAKWHLRKLLKINQEAIDRMYDRVYNDIIKEMNYSPKALTNITAEQLINKIGEASHVIDKIDKKGYHCVALEPMCSAVVELKGDNDDKL